MLVFDGATMVVNCIPPADTVTLESVHVVPLAIGIDVNDDPTAIVVLAIAQDPVSVTEDTLREVIELRRTTICVAATDSHPLTLTAPKVPSIRSK